MVDVRNNGGTIHDTVKFLGTGTVILHNGAQIRHYSVIEMSGGFLELKHGAILGFHSMVQATGKISIGEQTMIGPQCTLLASYHTPSFIPEEQRKLTPSTLSMGKNVWCGANVVFNHGIYVGDDSVIGANSFVNSNVEPRTIVFGNPAKFFRYKDE